MSRADRAGGTATTSFTGVEVDISSAPRGEDVEGSHRPQRPSAVHIDDGAGPRKLGAAITKLPATVRVAGYCMFFAFGMSCWWTVSAFSLELPAFLEVGLPEGKEIANDLNVAVTAGNAVVLFYILLPHRHRPSAQAVVMFLTVGLLASTVRQAARLRPCFAGSMPCSCD